MGLSAVFNQGQTIFFDQGHDFIHIACLSEQMDDQQSFDIRVFLQCFLDGRGTDVKRPGIDIRKNRLSAGINDGIRRSNK